ncbi:MAG: hypothetical protein IH840_14395 [Candidatus Heimdallarchaeota archaeon]|nr:hypothetical protein [Candidatus Heimdallarchaeota archaeon]
MTFRKNLLLILLICMMFAQTEPQIAHAPILQIPTGEQIDQISTDNDISFIRLIYPTASQVVNSGTPIDFVVITNPSNISSLTYTWDSGTEQTLDPNPIDLLITSPTTEGPHFLRFSIELLDGHNDTTNFTFLFDDTPPRLTNLEGLASNDVISGIRGINVSLSDLYGIDKAELILTKDNDSFLLDTGLHNPISGIVELRLNSLLVSDGEYLAQIKVSDDAGNIAIFSYTIFIENVQENINIFTTTATITTDSGSQRSGIVLGAGVSVFLLATLSILTKLYLEAQNRKQLEGMSSNDREVYENAKKLYTRYKQNR